jgi:hypothetical protein
MGPVFMLLTLPVKGLSVYSSVLPPSCLPAPPISGVCSQPPPAQTVQQSRKAKTFSQAAPVSLSKKEKVIQVKGKR